jgi:hypothetical protein
MLNLLFATTLSAYAQEPLPSSWGMKGFETQETRVMIGAVGEFWADPSIAQVYEPSSVFVNLSLRYRFHQHFSAGAELGLVDNTGNGSLSKLQLIPTVLHANVLFGTDRIEPFVGLGLSIVHFLETYPSSSISGSKVGLDFRSGFRIKTNFIQPKQHPKLEMGPKQMDIEIQVGQRLHQIFGFGAGEGFNMSALRLGVGLNTRF